MIRRKNTVVFFLGICILFIECTQRTTPVHPLNNNQKIFIYEPDGNNPAAGVTVKLFDKNSDENDHPVVAITNNEGFFTIDAIPYGEYTLWGMKDSLVCFQDSVKVTPTDTLFHNDTLECSSSLHGYGAVQSDHDPRTITIGIHHSDPKPQIVKAPGSYHFQQPAQIRRWVKIAAVGARIL